MKPLEKPIVPPADAAAREVGRVLGPDARWAGAQVTALMALLALVGGALVRPDVALPLFWNVVLPLVPLSLLLNPALWRGVCPVATLNLVPARLGTRRLSRRVAKWSGATGVVLLFVIVPARKFLLHQDGAAFTALVVLVGVAALILGLLYDTKAGFCNSVCPVLSVERLYGQKPLLPMGNPRCGGCELCTPRGCLDLAPGKAIAQTLGPTRRSDSWIGTAFGTFAAAFPGFVIGYGLTPVVEPGQAALVYLHVLAWSAASYLTARLVVRVGRIPAAAVMPFLAATAALGYFWFATPPLVGTLRLPPGAVLPVRVALAALVVYWLVVPRRATPTRDPSHPGALALGVRQGHPRP